MSMRPRLSCSPRLPSHVSWFCAARTISGELVAVLRLGNNQLCEVGFGVIPIHLELCRLLQLLPWRPVHEAPELLPLALAQALLGHDMYAMAPLTAVPCYTRLHR